MRMKLLDQKTEGGAKCYLCKVSLSDYVKSIPVDYKDYKVQRGIVSNKYLDKLIDTVANDRHIPGLVLVGSDFDFDDECIDVKGFRVLDGLQRTHRLKMMYDSILSFWPYRNNEDFKVNPIKFARKNKDAVSEAGTTTKMIGSLFDYKAFELSDPESFFANSSMWVEVWSGLTEEEEVNKMLLLNAGHKSVNIKHQLEILFLSSGLRLDRLLPESARLYREKDRSSILYSKSRKNGELHFSHVVSSLIALSAGKVVNTNSDFVSSLQSGKFSDVDLVEGFDYSLLKSFVSFFLSLDSAVHDKYGELGNRWLGREVVLVGIFGAIGNYVNQRNAQAAEYLDELSGNAFRLADILDLKGFEASRNRVELSKVNVGDVNKRAVYSFLSDYFEFGSPGKWADYFYVGGER